MARKVRHPYQILDASELVVDCEYCFVHITQNKQLVNRHVFKGFIQDSWLAVSGRGRSLSDVSIEQLKIDMFLNTSVINKPLFTIHNDGWYCENKTLDHPTIVYWYENRTGWDNLTTFIGGPERTRKSHYIIVASNDWGADPRMHTVNWINPDDTIKRVSLNIPDSPAEMERKIRKRTDDNLRELFGG